MGSKMGAPENTHTCPLYGRDHEIDIMQCAFERLISCEEKTPELILVTGDSGIGKTTLVHQSLKPKVESMNGFFIAGKHDQRERPLDYWAIVQALNEFVALVEESDSFEYYQKLIAPVIHTDRLLTDLVPVLNRFADSKRSLLPQTPNSETEQQLSLSVRQFFKAICSTKRPLVLLLDDLQWADHGSLGLLSDLVEDIQIHGLFIVGTCRDSEVSIEHLLSVTLREMERDGVLLCEIKLHPLERESVEKMVDDYGPKARSFPQLVDHVFERSKGNPFFVAQMIRALDDDDADGFKVFESFLNGTSIHFPLPNTVTHVSNEAGRILSSLELLAMRLDRIPRDQLDVMMIGACMGSQFTDGWIESVLQDIDVKGALHQLEKLQYVTPMRGLSRWCFCHDQIQQAAYMVIPRHEREEVHLMIGRRLWDRYGGSTDVDEEYLLLVANQLKLGARLIEKETERISLAQLLIDVSSISTSLASFKIAFSQLELGISLIGNRPWRDHYDLCLDLHNAAGEVCYYLCDYDRMESYTEEVISNARKGSDKLRAYTTRIYSLASRGYLNEALDLGVDTLGLYGYRFPAKIGMAGIKRELRKTMQMLEGKTDQDILSLPALSDPHTRSIIGLMNIMFVYAFLCRPLLSSLLCFRTVQLTIEYGASGPTCVSFGGIGLFLCNGHGDPREGYRFAKLATKILEEYKAFEWSARLSSVVCNFCFPIAEPVRDQLKPLLVSHRLSLPGDVQLALLCGVSYCGIGFYGCLSLPKLVEDCKTFIKIAQTRQQLMILDLLDPYLQFALNMVSPDEDSGSFSGSVLHLETALDDSLRTKNETLFSLICQVRIANSIYFEDYKQAVGIAEIIRKTPLKNPIALYNSAMVYLFSGIAYAEMESGPLDAKRRHLKNCLQQLRNIHKKCVNFENKVRLLEAETLMVKKDFHGALEKYKASIVCAKEEGLWNEIGLAYERASRALFRLHNETAACATLSNAIRSYTAWGATNKNKRLSRKLSILVSPSTRAPMNHPSSAISTEGLMAGSEFDEDAVAPVDTAVFVLTESPFS